MSIKIFVPLASTSHCWAIQDTSLGLCVSRALRTHLSRGHVTEKYTTWAKEPHGLRPLLLQAHLLSAKAPRSLEMAECTASQ